MTPPKLSWGHININVSHLEESIAFYQKLGFTEIIPGVPYLGIEREESKTVDSNLCDALGIPAGSTPRACIMQLDEGFPKIDLTEFVNDSSKGASANDDIGIVRICLATRDLAADYESLVRQGVEFLSEPTEGVRGMAGIAICRDPDGTLIELIEVHFEKWGN